MLIKRQLERQKIDEKNKKNRNNAYHPSFIEGKQISFVVREAKSQTRNIHEYIDTDIAVFEQIEEAIVTPAIQMV